MSSLTSKTSCVTCDKGVGQFKCEGCSQTFCTKHVAEHRQTLNQQLDKVILEHDTFQQTITEEKNQAHPLMTYIAQWEQKSIDKIRQAAKEAREQVSQLVDTHKKTIRQKMHCMKEQIKKAREEDDFFEKDLQNWISTLETLKQGLNTASLSVDMKEDETAPLVYQIRTFSSSAKVKSSQVSDKNRYNDEQMKSNATSSGERFEHLHGTARPTKNIHPLLQYTNKDGVYINPKSQFVTAIWYFYSPTNSCRFWTPYKNYDTWMRVDQLIVKSGCYKDQQPASINIEIIKYLQQNNPIPPDVITHAARKAENRILKI